MKTKTAVILGSVALAVLLLGAGFFIVRDMNSEPSYAVRITKAQDFFEKGDYDSAILEYKAAIEQDETKEDAYVGLAVVYYTQGYKDLSRQTLENGLIHTGGGVRVQTQLNIYFPDRDDDSVQDGPAQGEDKKDSDNVAVLNVELLQLFSSATYGDYKAQYADLRATMADGRCVVRIDSLKADLIFYNDGVSRVINDSTGRPYDEYRPNEIVLDDINVLFGGASRVTYSTLQTIQEIRDLKKSDGSVTFETLGCQVTASCDDSGVILSGAVNQIRPTNTGFVSSGDHVMSGSVIDAATGMAISGVRLRFYPGAGTFGSYTETTSDYTGKYSVTVSESGTFTVEVYKTGYITEKFRIYISAGSTAMRNNFTISPELEENEIRVVLTWGATPTDLDSYLTGTASDGTRVFVSFSNKTASKDGQTLAELDVDDVSSYGPETTTIYDINGSYYFDVVDFTGTVGVGPSGAVVKIYKGNTLVTTVTPSAGIGYGWRVCSIDHGNITVLDHEIPTTNGRPK